tara:strand:+ start:2745 stop:3080 length:336 start_codon:yes stop_codon:yes gene_type:complete
MFLYKNLRNKIFIKKRLNVLNKNKNKNKNKKPNLKTKNTLKKIENEYYGDLDITDKLKFDTNYITIKGDRNHYLNNIHSPCDCILMFFLLIIFYFNLVRLSLNKNSLNRNI